MIHIPLKEGKKFLLILCIVGFTGLSIPFTRDFFASLTPLFLITAFVVLMYYHQNWSVWFVAAALFIAVSGYLIEVFGVRTGIIFGNYQYGSILGVKWLDTPLIIGMNWLMLLYCVHSITYRWKLFPVVAAFIGAGIMVIYDMILEPIATSLNMWNWDQDIIPLQNYLGWFMFSFFILLLLNVFKFRFKNPVAFIVLTYQMIFFFLLHFTVTV